MNKPTAALQSNSAVPASELLDTALAALAHSTGITSKPLRARRQTGLQVKANDTVRLSVAGSDYRYQVICKPAIRHAAALAVLRTESQAAYTPTLLVTQYLSPHLAEQSRELGVQFIDAAGNASLQQPGLYVFVNGRKPLPGTPLQPAMRMGTPTALRIIFALLARPALINATYREIAHSAGVALGAIGPTLKALAARGMLLEGSTQRQLAAPARLMEEWIASYPLVLRPKLAARRFTADDPAWWKAVDAHALGAWWGGEVAAARLTRHLRPATQTLYVPSAHMPEAVRQLVTRFRLRSAAEGDIEIVEAFWQFSVPEPADLDLAPPLLVVADLMATLDPRNIEIAEMIRKTELQRAVDSF